MPARRSRAFTCWRPPSSTWACASSRAARTAITSSRASSCPSTWRTRSSSRSRSAPQPALTLELAGERAGVPADASNLALRAAAEFLAAAGLVRALRLRVTKRIPVAAGLGGGSSDAGAVLRGLAASFPGAIAAPALARLALRLGADVPYFLAPRPARVGGIGERSEPLAGPAGARLPAREPGRAARDGQRLRGLRRPPGARPARVRPRAGPRSRQRSRAGRRAPVPGDRAACASACARWARGRSASRAAGPRSSASSRTPRRPPARWRGPPFRRRSGPGSRSRRKLGSLTGRRSGVAMRGVGSRRAADPGASPNW